MLIQFFSDAGIGGSAFSDAGNVDWGVDSAFSDAGKVVPVFLTQRMLFQRVLTQGMLPQRFLTQGMMTRVF